MKGGKEGFGGKFACEFKVDCLGDKTYNYTEVTFVCLVGTVTAGFGSERTGVIHANDGKRTTRTNTSGRKGGHFRLNRFGGKTEAFMAFAYKVSKERAKADHPVLVKDAGVSGSGTGMKVNSMEVGTY